MEKSEEKAGWLAVDIHPWLFFTSAAVIIGSVVIAILFQAVGGDIFTIIQEGIATGAGWLFIMTMNIILVFVLVLMVSRYGNIRLGGSDAKPEFSILGWFAMLCPPTGCRPNTALLPAARNTFTQWCGPDLKRRFLTRMQSLSRFPTGRKTWSG